MASVTDEFEHITEKLIDEIRDNGAMRGELNRAREELGGKNQTIKSLQSVIDKGKEANQKLEDQRDKAVRTLRELAQAANNLLAGPAADDLKIPFKDIYTKAVLVADELDPLAF